MAGASMKEGRLSFEILSIDRACETFYKVVGDLSAGTPIVMLHGGPGAGHEYLLPYAELWSRHRVPVVFYDQIGCAASTHLPETAGDESFWQESLFIAQLDSLIDQLGIRQGFHLFGQSWGGMLGAAYAASRPRGLRRLVLASALASQELSMKGYQILRDGLPLEHQNALNEGDRSSVYDSPGYNAAVGVFCMKHLCRATPFPPPEMLPTATHLAEDTTVYATMYGPSALSMTGGLRNWTCIPRLSEIAAPTLVFNGECDCSHDIATAPFFENIPRVRWITLPNASHMCHLEGDELRHKILNIVGDFLRPEIAPPLDGKTRI